VSEDDDVVALASCL